MGRSAKLPLVSHQASRPVSVSGLFVPQYNWFETRAWHGVLILAENASSCKLTYLEFCKTRGDKLHEFIILYFTHPFNSGARATVVVDRAVKDRSQVSSIISPSLASRNPTEALDRVHVMGQTDSVATRLSAAYGQYDKLCTLKFTSRASTQPSAIQLSTLFSVVTKHRPNYNLYEYNCYWYADTIFEACKKLFSGRENCIRHRDRGRCRLKLPMHATHTLQDICNEYNDKWSEVNDDISGLSAQSTSNERSAAEAAQQERELAPGEEQRTREAALEQRSKVLEQTLQEERKASKAREEELERKLEEAERRLEQLQTTKRHRRPTPYNGSLRAHRD